MSDSTQHTTRRSAARRFFESGPKPPAELEKSAELETSGKLETSPGLADADPAAGTLFGRDGARLPDPAQKQPPRPMRPLPEARPEPQPTAAQKTARDRDALLGLRAACCIACRCLSLSDSYYRDRDAGLAELLGLIGPGQAEARRNAAWSAPYAAGADPAARKTWTPEGTHCRVGIATPNLIQTHYCRYFTPLET